MTNQINEGINGVEKDFLELIEQYLQKSFDSLDGAGRLLNLTWNDLIAADRTLRSVVLFPDMNRILIIILSQYDFSSGIFPDPSKIIIPHNIWKDATPQQYTTIVRCVVQRLKCLKKDVLHVQEPSSLPSSREALQQWFTDESVTEDQIEGIAFLSVAASYPGVINRDGIKTQLGFSGITSESAEKVFNFLTWKGILYESSVRPMTFFWNEDAKRKISDAFLE